jgi:nicotinate-nucleotide adenylyltransferase
MKIGIFGGTFDPPHFGHLKLAESALEQLGLDEVIFLPANTNPFKQKTRTSPSKDRLQMTAILVSNHPQFAVSDMEITRGGLSYTIDTIGELQMVSPGEYWVLLGADSLKGFENWKNPQRILRAARLAVAVRPPINKDELLRTVPAEFHDRIDIISMEPMEHSSTEIREKVSRNVKIDRLTSPEIVDYIKKNKLYQLK